MEDKQPIEIPKSFELDNYIYTYKDELINNFYSYRWKHKTICKITINVAKSEIIKYIKSKSINIASKEKIIYAKIILKKIK